MPAKDIFSAIISKFEIPLPSLLANPIDYILQLTKSVLPNDESIFPIKTWKQRLDYMEEHITAVERYIIELEDAAAKKSIVELTEKMTSMDISIVPTEDLKHILFEVIMPLMELDNRIETTEDIYNFCKMLIDIIDQHIQEIDGDELKKCLRLMLNIIESSDCGSKELSLLDRIANMTDSREGYDVITLGALGVVSQYKPEEEQIIIKNEIVNRGKNKIDDYKIARIVLLTLCRRILIEKKMDKEEKDLLDDIYNKNIENDGIVRIYFTNILSFVEDGIDIYEDIDDVIKRIENSSFKRKQHTIIRAIYIKGSAYENKLQMLNLYENSLSDYKQEQHISCSECNAFIYMVYKIVTTKIEMNEYIERKYIDMIIDLSEEEVGCEIISGNIVLILRKYVDYIENDIERKEILKRCILICDISKMYREWRFICDKYTEIIDEIEKKSFMRENPKYGQSIKADALISNAIDDYVNLKKRECLSQLLEASEIYDSIFGEEYNAANINIAYMVRRGEAQEIELEAIDLLDSVKRYSDDVFLCINKYLCYWKKNMHKQAIDELMPMDDRRLESALEWWTNDKIVENEEKYCVLFGLAISGFDINDKVNIYAKKFWEECLEYVDFPSIYVKFIKKILDLEEIQKDDIRFKLD